MRCQVYPAKKAFFDSWGYHALVQNKVASETLVNVKAQDTVALASKPENPRSPARHVALTYSLPTETQ